jgi:hypothetical protein
MNTTIEDDVRASLQAWAQEVRPSPGDPADAMNRPAPGDPRRHRDARKIAIGAAAAVLVAAVLVSRQSGNDLSTGNPGPGPGTAPATSPTGGPQLGEPGMVVFRPADPAWKLMGFRFSHDSMGDSQTIYGYAHSSGRHFELALYPPGTRTQGSAPRPGERLEVRGFAAFATDEGPPRYRLDWDEAGRTWEADGQPFAGGVGELARLLADFAVVDRDTWLASLPTDLAELQRANPTASLEWRQSTGAKLVHDPPVVAPCPESPVQPTEACSGGARGGDGATPPTSGLRTR